jgi:hypothetical protein
VTSLINPEAPSTFDWWVGTWLPWPAAGKGFFSTVNEPSVANSGKFVFETGNWYGSFSTNDGTSFITNHPSANPFTTFPASDGGFCCDQTAIYDPSRDLLFWLLMYVNDASRNRLRLAITSPRSIPAGGVPTWFFYDFTSDGISGIPAGDWFDFPDMALGTNYLYVTSNMFGIANPQPFKRTLIMRLPLDALATGAGFGFNYFADSSHASFRAAQGLGTTAYWGAHNSTSSMRIFRWSENSGTIFWDDVGVNAWSNAGRLCPGPAGCASNWCGDLDSRITGAALGKIPYSDEGVLTFMWSASQGGSFPFPYQDVARFRTSDRTLIDQPIIWNSTAAWAYGNIAPNIRGDLGVSIFFGGGTSCQDHVIGIIDEYNLAPGTFIIANASNTGNVTRSGDYLGCRPHWPDGLNWIASGFSYQSALGGYVAPNYDLFGRDRDSNALRRNWGN